MILAVDIGNTNVKLGFFQNDKLENSFKMTTVINRTSDEYSAMLVQMMTNNNIKVSDVTGAILSCVIPQLEYTFVNLIKNLFGIKPIMVGVGVKTGLSIKYEFPKQLGSDRIVTCVAAIKKYGAPFVLVDFGTATTFNVVNEKKEFLGGCITLGIKAKSDSLSSKTSKLPSVQLERPKKTICTNTTNAIQSGIVFGTVGEVKYIIERIKKESNLDNVKVVATGGLAEIIEDIEHIFDVVDRQLSLYGLNEIYKLNA